MDKEFITCKDCKHRHTENCSRYQKAIFENGETVESWLGGRETDFIFCAKGERNAETELQANLCEIYSKNA